MVLHRCPVNINHKSYDMTILLCFLHRCPCNTVHHFLNYDFAS